MRYFVGQILMGLLPVLAACDKMVIVGQSVFNLNYTVDEFSYASRNGEIRTRIGDDPFGGPHAKFSAVVSKLMYGANIGGDVAFTLSPGGPGSGRYHVVMLFNPPVSAKENFWCADASFPTLPLTDTLRLVSAFCFKDSMLSTANGRVSDIRSPQSPLFRDLVRQVTLALFPGYDDLDIGDSSGRTTE